VIGDDLEDYFQEERDEHGMMETRCTPLKILDSFNLCDEKDVDNESGR
jgi:hypothetical protein